MKLKIGYSRQETELVNGYNYQDIHTRKLTILFGLTMALLHYINGQNTKLQPEIYTIHSTKYLIKVRIFREKTLHTFNTHTCMTKDLFQGLKEETESTVLSNKFQQYDKLKREH